VHTGVAFLIVCDMLLTGFDAPIEQVMYIDKKVKDHNLLQTIVRVNRIAKGKTRGYIVDYIGLANHLKEALFIYAADDQEDIKDALKDITGELPVLESRYQRLAHLFHVNGVTNIEGFVRQTILDPKHTFTILEQAIEGLEDLQRRATFEVYMKQFMQSLDIILPHAAAHPYKIPIKRFGYILAKVKERHKDDSLNISGAGEKVKQLTAPFYDLIGRTAFGMAGIPAPHADRVKQLVAEVIEALQQTIDIIDFWTNQPAISQLKGKLSDLMLFTGIDAIIVHSDRIVTEITALAKVRHQDLIG
jgi:hypothetical protein